MELPRITLTDDQLRVGRNYGAARNGKHEKYEGLCSEHGWVDFFTASKKCTLCKKRMGRAYKNEARANARRVSELMYVDRCAVHGETMFDVAKGKCVVCSAGPIGRPLTDGARATARRAGKRVYAGQCDTHGEAMHSVASGRCLKCFTMNGAPRAERPSWDVP